MKRIIVLAAALISSLMAVAQRGGKSVDERAMHQADKMKEVLNLSDNQYNAITDINKRYSQQFSDLKKENQTGKDKMQGLRKQRAEEINKVLNADQQVKWQSYKKERREDHQQRRHDHRERMNADVKSKLSLSDDQWTKFSAEQELFHDKARALRSNTSLTDDSKKDELKKLQAEHESKVKAILNADQFKTWQDMKQQKREHVKKMRNHGHY